MPYKIVQTFEGKKFKLTTVPSGWETDNVLRYPKKALSKYIQDENSTPQLDWDVMMCKVKRLNISSYEDGEKLVTDMMTRGDTDDDNDYHPQKPYLLKNQEALNLNIVADRIVKPRRPQNNQPDLNLNNMAENMVGNVLYFENPQPVLADNIYTVNVPYETNNPAMQETINIYPDNISENQKQMLEHQRQMLNNQAMFISQMTENQKQLIDNTTAILGNVQSLIKVQSNIIEKVSGLSVQLEDAVLQITGIHNREVINLKDSKYSIDNTPFHIPPIDSSKELDKIEKQLSDSNIRNRLKNTYSILCSKGGKGIDCAYTLVDIMFTRTFICQCSWSGGSRGEDLKIPLKGYKHVLSFFWEMIHFWDENFTLKDNEVFFKTILKNAHKRKLAKCERASTSRNRPKPSSSQKRQIEKKKKGINIGVDSENKQAEKERSQTNKEDNEETSQEHYGDDEGDEQYVKNDKNYRENECKGQVEKNTYKKNTGEDGSYKRKLDNCEIRASTSRKRSKPSSSQKAQIEKERNVIYIEVESKKEQAEKDGNQTEEEEDSDETSQENYGNDEKKEQDTKNEKRYADNECKRQAENNIQNKNAGEDGSQEKNLDKCQIRASTSRKRSKPSSSQKTQIEKERKVIYIGEESENEQAEKDRNQRDEKDSDETSQENYWNDEREEKDTKKEKFYAENECKIEEKKNKHKKNTGEDGLPERKLDTCEIRASSSSKRSKPSSSQKAQIEKERKVIYIGEEFKKEQAEKDRNQTEEEEDSDETSQENYGNDEREEQDTKNEKRYADNECKRQAEKKIHKKNAGEHGSHEEKPDKCEIRASTSRKRSQPLSSQKTQIEKDRKEIYIGEESENEQAENDRNQTDKEDNEETSQENYGDDEGEEQDTKNEKSYGGENECKGEAEKKEKINRAEKQKRRHQEKTTGKDGSKERQ